MIGVNKNYCQKGSGTIVKGEVVLAVLGQKRGVFSTKLLSKGKGHNITISFVFFWLLFAFRGFKRMYLKMIGVWGFYSFKRGFRGYRQNLRSKIKYFYTKKRIKRRI